MDNAEILTEIQDKPYKSRYSYGFKLMAVLLLGTFLFRDIAWALDYGTTTKNLLNKQQKSGTWNKPGYLVNQQNKHEQMVLAKQQIAGDALILRKSIDSSLEYKLRAERQGLLMLNEENTRRGGTDGSGSGGPLTRYTLGGPDGEGGFKTININFFDKGGSITKTETHRISGNPDAAVFIQNARDLGDGVMGSTHKLDTTVFTDKTLDSVTVYKKKTGQVSHVLSGFDVANKQWARVSTYEYAGEKLRMVNTYDTENLAVDFYSEASRGSLPEGKLLEIGTFEERGKQSVQVKSYSLATHLTTSFIYDVDQKIKETKTTNSDGQLVRVDKYNTAGAVVVSTDVLRNLKTEYHYDGERLKSSTTTNQKNGIELYRQTYVRGSDKQDRVAALTDHLSGMTTEYSYDSKDDHLLKTITKNRDGLAVRETLYEMMKFRRDKAVEETNLLTKVVKQFNYREDGSLKTIETFGPPNASGMRTKIQTDTFESGPHGRGDQIMISVNEVLKQTETFQRGKDGSIEGSLIVSESGDKIASKLFELGADGADRIKSSETLENGEVQKRDFIYDKNGALEVVLGVLAKEGRQIGTISEKYGQGPGSQDRIEQSVITRGGETETTIYVYDEKTGGLSDVNKTNTKDGETVPSPTIDAQINTEGMSLIASSSGAPVVGGIQDANGTTTFTYDANSNITSAQIVDTDKLFGGKVIRTTTETFEMGPDGQSRIVSRTTLGGNPDEPVSVTNQTFSYDSLGNLTGSHDETKTRDANGVLVVTSTVDET